MYCIKMIFSHAKLQCNKKSLIYPFFYSVLEMISFPMFYIPLISKEAFNFETIANYFFYKTVSYLYLIRLFFQRDIFFLTRHLRQFLKM